MYPRVRLNRSKPRELCKVCHFLSNTFFFANDLWIFGYNPKLPLFPRADTPPSCARVETESLCPWRGTLCSTQGVRKLGFSKALPDSYTKGTARFL